MLAGVPLLLVWEGWEKGVFCERSGFSGCWSPPRFPPSHDTTPQPMNIYETKLLQLRRFISSGKSCSAAQEAVVSHAVLDVSGFQPNMADSVCHLQTSAGLFTAQRTLGESEFYLTTAHNSSLSHLDTGSNQSSFLYLLNTLRGQRCVVTHILDHEENPLHQRSPKYVNRVFPLQCAHITAVFLISFDNFLISPATSHIQPVLLWQPRPLPIHNQSVMCLKRRDCAGLCLVCFTLMQAT